MLRTLGSILIALTSGASVVGAETPDQVVAQAQRLAANHRYQEAIDRLEPLENSVEHTDLQYIVAAELGRSLFHLGRYQEAHTRFQRAVKLQPQHVETALYLQATAYLLGDRDQAWLILRAVLESGAKDLYLAVTLPGERRFLSDPEAWTLMEEFALPIGLDLETGSVFGVSLGQPRSEVVSALGTASDSKDGKALTAQAGPHLVWGFAFDDSDELSEVVLQVENLVKYTPYRLGFGGSDWRASPAELGAIMGPPSATSSDEENVLVMSWTRPTFTATAAFGHPRPPRPPGIADGVAMLRLIRLRRHEPSEAVTPPNSDSMNP
jgi:tetratricopeptide (TPR) repeat protein